MANAISPRRILIVDDHAGCREAWQLVCEDLWPEVSTVHAASLSEALAYTDVDMVLSDLSLPDSSPVETVRALVAAFPAWVPLVLLSGSVDSLQGYELLRLGADAFFLKGGDTAALVQTLYSAWVAYCGRLVRQVQARERAVCQPL